MDKAVVKCSHLVANGKKRGYAVAAGAIVSDLIPLVGAESAAPLTALLLVERLPIENI